MFKSNTPKPLSTYTSLKRKWQDSSDEEDLKEEDSISDAEQDIDELDSSASDSDVSLLVSALDALKGNSSIPLSTRQQFQSLLPPLLQSCLQELQRAQTTTKELVDAFSSLISKLDSSSPRNKNK